MKKDQTHINQKLLVLYLLDEISQPGRNKVEAWLDSSETNRIYFEGFRKTWEETGKVDPSSVAFDTNRAWAKMNARLNDDVGTFTNIHSPSTGPRPLLTMTRFFVVAAAVLLLGVMSVLFVRFLQKDPSTGMVTLASYAVPVQDTLTDGSTVVLNTGSKLVVPKKFASAGRSVELQGEAFFQVQHDAERPFIIDAGLGQIKVLGTSFQVKAYPGSNLEVFVESGRVELSVTDSLHGDTTKIVLKAGERGMIRVGSQEISKPAEIGPDELFWANKKLIFQETKLSLVFDLLKEHYDAKIDVKDAAVLNCLLSATFTDESIDQILEVVAASFDLKMSKKENTYLISGKGCNNEK